MIADANWRQRVTIFRQAEECKEENKEEYDKLMKEYQDLLRGEE